MKNEKSRRTLVAEMATKPDDLTIEQGVFAKCAPRTPRDPERLMKIDPNSQYATIGAADEP